MVLASRRCCERLRGFFSPDKGTIDLHGRSVSLLSIGVGFNNKLTGRENIYLSGMLLGFSEEEIAKKEKDIIKFADIGKFMYKPVKLIRLVCIRSWHLRLRRFWKRILC